MKAYADRIGADYLFELNPRFVTDVGKYSPHYGAFKPIYTSSFHDYDNVLYADTDVFPVEGLTENIFEEFDHDIGICTEPFQPKQRAKIPGPISKEQDEKWASVMKKEWGVDMPRTDEGLLKVYNSGVVLYSNAGMKAARDKFVPFKKYVRLVKAHGLPNFYTADQNYLHAMLKVATMNYTELDAGWNSFVHKYHTDATKQVTALNDSRTPTTKFVHIQLRSADNWDAKKLWRVTNRPAEEWDA